MRITDQLSMQIEVTLQCSCIVRHHLFSVLLSLIYPHCNSLAVKHTLPPVEMIVFKGKGTRLTRASTNRQYLTLRFSIKTKIVTSQHCYRTMLQSNWQLRVYVYLDVCAIQNGKRVTTEAHLLQLCFMIKRVKSKAV
jgi:hypothetical protein